MSELHRLERLFFEGKISRRTFMAKVSALGITAALSPALLSNTVQADVPKRGGRLKIGCGGGAITDSLDPATLVQIMPQMINHMLRSHLTELNHNMEIEPKLAQSWEPNADATKWIFHLHKGVEFHNGKTVDSDDVVYSLNYHRGKDSKSAASGIVEPIKDIKRDGKYKVIFTLNEGNADFPFIVSEFHLSIVPKGTKGAELEKGMGSGPFQLVNFEPGVRALLKRNQNYFIEGLPYFDEVEIIDLEDITARNNALKTGEVDIINRCDRKTVHFLERTPGIQVLKLNGMKHFSVPMNTKIKPYDNNDVRLALKYAFDREQLVDLVLRGYGYVGNDHPISRINRYYASELPQRPYDPEKARFHLKKAGLLGQSFNLHTADAAFPGAVDAAVLVKEHAKKAGININVVREPNDGYWSDVWMNKEWCWCYWQGRPTEDWMFSTVYAADANWNDAFWKHDRFNRLLKEARAELDESKRRDMYVEMQRIVRDEGATVIPIFAQDLHAATTKLKYKNVAANWEFDGMRIGERWWFAS